MKCLINKVIIFVMCLCLLSSVVGCKKTKEISLNYTNGYQLEYVENTSESGVLISGMKNNLKFDVEKVNYDEVQRLFHPQVKYRQENYATNVLYSASSNSVTGNIYTPILFEKENSYEMMYGGWDMISSEGLSQQNHGVPIDRLFMATIEDKTLTTWQNDTNNNRRLIIESDYLNDRSLFHINDPTVIDLGNGHLRAYFEMESLNKPSSFIKLGSTSSLSDDKVSNLEAADDTEEGIPIHGIAMAESFNSGQTWQGVNSQKEGKVTRDDYIFIEGINIYSYAYWQIGWPSIVRLGDKFIMYFNMFARADFTNKKVSTAKTWKQYWRNERVEIDFNFSSNVGPAGNLVVCESDDGKNFKFIGSVTNAMDRSGAYCYNPDVKKIDEETLLITYNSDTFEYNNEGELEKNILSSWGTGLSYIKADKLTNVYQINRNSQNTMSTEALAFYPYLFGGDRRSSVTPQLLQNSQGDVIGIGYGQWQTPGNSNSYIAAAYLQNYALIKQNGKTVAGVNLSKNPDEAIIVSHSDSSFVSNGEVMISYNLNNLNVNKISKIKNATIEIYNIYGEKLLQTKPFTLKVGDKFVLKKV